VTRRRTAVPLAITQHIPPDPKPAWRSIRFDLPWSAGSHLYEPDEKRTDRRTKRHLRLKAMLFAMADTLGLQPVSRHARVRGYHCGYLRIYRGQPSEQDKKLWQQAVTLAQSAELPPVCLDERVCPQPIRAAKA
jgi:hypothetical protein